MTFCAPPSACCLSTADHPAAWDQVPSAKSIYSSSFAWASHLITSPALPSEYPLLLVGERAKDQVSAARRDTHTFQCFIAPPRLCRCHVPRQ